MNKKELIEFINEQLQDLKEPMEECKDQNSCYYGMLMGEQSALISMKEFLLKVE